MFTGLVQTKGKITNIIPNSEGRLLKVHCPSIAADIKIDDSVAINGVCQTAISVDENSFTAQAIHTTLEKTNFKYLKVGEEINLELALRLSDRLGGHIVQGHVGGVGQISSLRHRGKNIEMTLVLPNDLLKYCILEGSICLDGISLTIAGLESSKIMVSLIPHTVENTHLKNKRIGDYINIEVDVLAKYVERLLGKNNRETQTSDYQNSLREILG
ncbi:MAG: riboflavin synthase [Bacteriovoracaceae bacterium]|nr:riboflavin synthase [Bacteriovoracaceae bacterium]